MEDLSTLSYDELVERLQDIANELAARSEPGAQTNDGPPTTGSGGPPPHG